MVQFKFIFTKTIHVFHFFLIAPNLKNNRIIVEMINQLGLDEAGIDGGGLFREFLLQLLENGFDPNRGFFVLTSDGFLYPNPHVSFLVENYATHYFFLGRMLAKVLFLN
jgi:ubiquitin-protein ligase E3 C